MPHHIESRKAITFKFDVMKKKEQLKNSVSEAFKSGNYSLAFDLLLTLEHYEVADYLSKNDIVNLPKVKNFFRDKYCLEHFEASFLGKSSEIILNWYLKDLSKVNHALNQQLVSEIPDIFIKIIKRNRAFLNEDFYLSIQDLIWSKNYEVDINAMLIIKNEHYRLQELITKGWKKIENLGFYNLLCYVILWMEEQFSITEDPGTQERLRSIFNYSISFLFSKIKPIQPLDENGFDRLFIESIYKPEKNKIDFFLCRINEWLEFELTILTSYCFDDNFVANDENGEIQFDFSSQEEYVQYQNDTNRYLVNERRYLRYAAEIMNVQLEDGTLQITGSDEEAQNLNGYLHLQYLKLIMILSDLEIDQVTFKGNKSGFKKLIHGLITYSYNRQNRYSNSMRNMIFQGLQWHEAYFRNIQNSVSQEITNAPLAYIYEDRKEIISFFLNAADFLDEQEIENMISHFTYSFTSTYTFDPFRIRYSVWETPFLNIGNMIFTPMCFFTSNDWFYGMVQRGLRIYSNNYHENEKRKTSRKMEDHLAKNFEKMNFNSFVFTESSKIDGDIDVFVNDGKTQLLIQLKRTRLKLDLAAEYREQLETDLKGSGQINQAILSLKENPELGIAIYEHPVKWVVTTSFERVLTEIDGCLKVNYFDLIWALRNVQFNSLADLVKYIEGDRPYRDCISLLDIEI